jgi:hypothetical protein
MSETFEVVERFRRWVKQEKPNQSTEEITATLDEFADTFMAHGAMCRLLAGAMRGEDVPDSIYPADDEDPADTARWARWRLS